MSPGLKWAPVQVNVYVDEDVDVDVEVAQLSLYGAVALWSPVGVIKR